MSTSVVERRRKKVRYRVVLLVAAILVGMVLAEVGARLYAAGRRTVRYTIHKGSPQFSDTLNDQSPLFYEHTGLETDRVTQVTLRYGDGEPRRFPFEPPESTYRVVAVGDSLTEHWSEPGYVNYTDFLRECLQRALPDQTVEVVSLGVGGYNTWQEMQLFKRDYQGLKSDLLLLQWCSNDGDVMTLRRRDEGEPVPARGWPSYDIVGERYGHADTRGHRLGPFESYLWWLVRTRLSAPHSLHGFRQVAGNDEQRQAFIWFRDLAKARRTPLLVATFPMMEDRYSQAELDYVKPLLQELGIRTLDLSSALRSGGSLARLTRDRYHPNPQGYQVAAEAICDYLEAQALLP